MTSDSKRQVTHCVPLPATGCLGSDEGNSSGLSLSMEARDAASPSAVAEGQAATCSIPCSSASAEQPDADNSQQPRNSPGQSPSSFPPPGTAEWDNANFIVNLVWRLSVNYAETGVAGNHGRQIWTGKGSDITNILRQGKEAARNLLDPANASNTVPASSSVLNHTLNLSSQGIAGDGGAQILVTALEEGEAIAEAASQQTSKEAVYAVLNNAKMNSTEAAVALFTLLARTPSLWGILSNWAEDSG